MMNYCAAASVNQMTNKEGVLSTWSPLNSWKAIKELYKITFTPKKDNRLWLRNQTIWVTHIPSYKEIKHPNYDVTKPK